MFRPDPGYAPPTPHMTMDRAPVVARKSVTACAALTGPTPVRTIATEAWRLLSCSRKTAHSRSVEAHSSSSIAMTAIQNTSRRRSRHIREDEPVAVHHVAGGGDDWRGVHRPAI